MKNKIKSALVSIAIFTLLISQSCTTSSTKNEVYECPMHCEKDKTYSDKETCPVCKMDLVAKKKENVKIKEGKISDASIFNLTSKWNTQNGDIIELKDLKGDVLVMVMIYTNCKAACPRLVADMRSINKKVQSNKVKYVLVSIDPENDTPKKLKKFSIQNQMDSKQWIFLQGTIDNVREFSNVLAVKYKQISPIDFSHSNIISVFNKKGELIHQQEGLGVNNETTVNKIRELVGRE